MHQYDCELFSKSSFGSNGELCSSNMTHVMFHAGCSCRRSLSHVFVLVRGLGKVSERPLWVEGMGQISARNALSQFLSTLVQGEAERWSGDPLEVHPSLQLPALGAAPSISQPSPPDRGTKLRRSNTSTQEGACLQA